MFKITEEYLRLNTKVIDPSSQKKYVPYSLIKSFVGGQDHPQVWKRGEKLCGGFQSFLYVVQDNKPKELGYIDIAFEPDEYYPPLDVKIEFRRNTSGWKNVGWALEECAFMLSLFYECEGRLKNEASLNAHAFHYKTGKRFIDENLNKKMESMLAANPGDRLNTEDFGTVPMELPPESIVSYLKRFGLMASDRKFTVQELKDFSLEQSRGLTKEKLEELKRDRMVNRLPLSLRVAKPFLNKVPDGSQEISEDSPISRHKQAC